MIKYKLTDVEGEIFLKNLILPEGYDPILNIYDTEIAIKLIKDTFERKLAKKLSLTRVSAPLFVSSASGLNDNLNGVERAVEFDIRDADETVQIVHSLAKWKRHALKRYSFSSGFGLYTDVNAIRRDEELDNLHSVYVDQWDWEKIITVAERNVDFLKQTVTLIVEALHESEAVLCEQFPKITPFIEKNIKFITAEELLQKYPTLSPKERENAICREYHTVFIIGIGDKLSNGEPHDGRAPDYDDWSLNGDLLVWYPVLGRAVELSSMGIRVSPESLASQLEKSNCQSRKDFPFHKALLNGELPLTIGGGIGQSRLCLVLLHRAHIGEVQASTWRQEMIDTCSSHNIFLL